MSQGYQDFFKKRKEALKNAGRKKVKGRIGGAQIWSIALASLLMAGCAWFLVSGEEKATKLFSKIEISVFGEASAEEKTADEAQKSEAKESTPDGKAKVQTATIQKTWTDEEVALFMKLDARKKQLDAREQELAKLEEELQKHKEEIEKRLTALEDVRGKIAAKLEDKVKVDQQKVEALVSVYANMKPVQAAKIIETINEDLAVEVLSKMKNKSAAEIVNLMDPDKAKKISEHFAGFREPATASAK